MKKHILYDIEDKKLIAPRGIQPTDPLRQERDLYSYGQVKMPRSMLYSRTWIDLPRASKTLYLWLLTKREILYRATRRGIRTAEAVRYMDDGTVTTTGSEIKTYTGISSKNIKRCFDGLREAGLVKTKQVTSGDRTMATVCKLALWQTDKTGYIKVPMKLLLSPAYIKLDHGSKAFYLIMISEHWSRRKASIPFPHFEAAYSQLVPQYGSSATIARMIKALEDAGMLGVDHGEWVRRDTEIKDEEDGTDNKKKKPKKTGRASVYWIKTDYLYLYTEINNTDNNHENNRHSPE